MTNLFDQIIAENVTKQAATAALAELQLADKKNFLNPEKKKFDEAKTAIEKLESLVVFVPCQLPDGVMGRLGKYAREVFGNKNLVLDFKTDQKLLAGAALAWQGKYTDYSKKI